jgi:hypothetical protein
MVRSGRAAKWLTTNSAAKTAIDLNAFVMVYRHAF